jgi:hypothetical protein
MPLWSIIQKYQSLSFAQDTVRYLFGGGGKFLIARARALFSQNLK